MVRIFMRHIPFVEVWSRSTRPDHSQTDTRMLDSLDIGHDKIGLWPFRAIGKLAHAHRVTCYLTLDMMPTQLIDLLSKLGMLWIIRPHLASKPISQLVNHGKGNHDLLALFSVDFVSTTVFNRSNN